MSDANAAAVGGLPMMHVQPAEGRRVIDPASGAVLPPAGAEVPRDSYWLRRRDDGDVIEVAPPSNETAAPGLGGAKAGKGKE